MMGALASLGSIFGGGGKGGGLIPNSGASNGDLASDASYHVGNMTFGAVGANSSNNQMMIIAAVAVVGLLVWMKK
ncbi:hypothetical protein [Thalassotalea piscium]|uniref:Uncharacterized protein n=1 Tax=Thalassotalea piscium TaxID=1230533 RepID=A0A7X0NGD4_9GAMM|nr:hypothetical protein [Thalassotalea piscium]MBB6542858.1 hypothetical protein [Thalassotalea piscium]